MSGTRPNSATRGGTHASQTAQFCSAVHSVALAWRSPPWQATGTARAQAADLRHTPSACRASRSRRGRSTSSRSTARKAFEAQRKAAKKAFKAQEKAARQAFHQLHPNPTDAELKAFHDQQKAASEGLPRLSGPLRSQTFHDQQSAASKAFHTQQEAAKKAC